MQGGQGLGRHPPQGLRGVVKLVAWVEDVLDRWGRVGWVWEWERGRQGKGDIVDPGRMRARWGTWWDFAGPGNWGRG